MGGQADDLASRRATEMFVVVDPDEVPGLRNIMRRQQAGHDFEVVTRCGVGMSGGAGEVPIALVNVAFMEVGLAVEIAIEADEYRNSLLELIRTRQLTIMDSDRSLALQSLPPAQAFRQGLSITVPIGNAEPIMGLLQQRVDLPMPIYAPLAVDLDVDNRAEAVEAFLEDARLPAGMAIQYRDNSRPSIILVDNHLPPAPTGHEPTKPLLGRWGAMSGGGRAAIRLDVFAEDGRFGSWLVPEPDPRFIRAGASGAHHVMLLRESISQDQREAERQWAAGVSVWVEHVEALRALLKDLD
jgi:hypothetical protein